MWNCILDEHLSLQNTFDWMLLTFGFYFNIGKLECLIKKYLLFTKEPWRNEYLKRVWEITFFLLFFFFPLFVQFVEVFVSATLPGVETSKYPPFLNICFFDEVFSFFTLVRNFFSKWIFSKTGFVKLANDFNQNIIT